MRKRIAFSLLVSLGILHAQPPAPAASPATPGAADMHDWFVELDGTNGYYASPGVPSRAIEALREAQKGGEELKSFSFTPAGDWVALSLHRFRTSDEGLGPIKRLAELESNNASYKCMRLGPLAAGPFYLGRNSNWTTTGPPAAASDKYFGISRNGGTLRSVAYGPHNSWVVLSGEADVAYQNIPADLAKLLDNAARNHIPIQCVAFTGSDWIVLAPDAWWTSNKDLAVSKVVDQNFKLGLHPKWIAFVPSMGPFNAEKFESIIRQTMAGKLAGGYACLAIDHGKTVASFAEGWARAPWEKTDRKVKWTIDTRMSIASVSKTVTAVALLKLWEESQGSGRPFSLDEPFWTHINRMVPDADPEVKTITIRQIPRKAARVAGQTCGNTGRCVTGRAISWDVSFCGASGEAGTDGWVFRQMRHSLDLI